MSKDCKDCIHWYRHGSEETGDCRCNPPVPFLIQQVHQMTRQVNQGTLGVYPPVKAEGLACGKFQPDPNLVRKMS